MKKIVFLLLITCLSGIYAFSQKTYYPLVESQGEPNLKIQIVEITKDFTVISFVYTHNRRDTTLVDIEPRIQIIAVGGKRTFKFIKAEGIPVGPQQIRVGFGQRLSFKVYFEKMEPGIERIDIFECTNYDRMICFNFYGVLIKNPEIIKPQDTPPLQPTPTKPTPTQPTPTKPTPQKPDTTKQKPVPAPVVTFTGKVLDAKTQKPVVATITIEALPSMKEVSKITSAATGDYKTTLSPKFIYSVSASAKGYLVTEENLDLLKAVDKQVITKTILLKPVEIGETIRLNDVYFAQSQSVLLSSSFGELDKLAKIMQQNATMEILLEGHTDIIGNPNDNLKLSQDRVNAVKAYLVKKGIPDVRIQTKAYGGTKPIKTDGSVEDRQVNRRVEFKILKK